MPKRIVTTVLLAVSTAAGAAAQPAPEYDLLIKGGRVVDPKNGLDTVRDVAVKDGRIASTAVPMIAAGFLPDSISTDLHTSSMNSAMKSWST